MYWDRFDICAAYYWYAVQYHFGQNCEWYKVLGRLYNLGFVPSRSIEYGKLEENAQEIYESLTRKHCPFCTDIVAAMPMTACPEHARKGKNNATSQKP
jgi:hypothetical protein